MNKPEATSLGCWTLLIGVLFSILIPAILLGSGIYINALWIILMPGWAVFRPGRDDGFGILMATILDAMIWWAIAYGVIYSIVKRTGRANYE
ncbi:MAG: hypothetical protein QOF61_2580 [Acidobacteriota bacterium]|jgi:hypothetical protein|nr:hypothetical protein [Acidobacteriota bacterium]